MKNGIWSGAFLKVNVIVNPDTHRIKSRLLCWYWKPSRMSWLAAFTLAWSERVEVRGVECASLLCVSVLTNRIRKRDWEETWGLKQGLCLPAWRLSPTVPLYRRCQSGAWSEDAVWIWILFQIHFFLTRENWEEAEYQEGAAIAILRDGARRGRANLSRARWGLDARQGDTGSCCYYQREIGI